MLEYTFSKMSEQSCDPSQFNNLQDYQLNNTHCKSLKKTYVVQITYFLCIVLGVMKLDDLKHVFKSSSIGLVDTRGYIVNLLNKFEVALTWDSRTLLIPSLLPSEESMRTTHTQLVRVKVLHTISYSLL